VTTGGDPTQREAPVLAVESGYDDIPRTCTTVELGEKLGVSDRAVTERSPCPGRPVRPTARRWSRSGGVYYSPAALTE